MPKRDLAVWTIGHSTRSAEEFLKLLCACNIEMLVDVRRFPGSRKYPHFNSDELREFLSDADIGYKPLPALGGRRRPNADSPNSIWRNASFRGYADYMETPGFQAGIEQLLEIASRARAAIMCSEAVWWRCHRSMIADYLKAMGVEVFHILALDKIELHPYTSAARLVNGQLSYRPAPPGTPA